MSSREYRGVGFAVVLFLLVQLGALALVQTFFEQGYQAVENPNDPTISLVYIGAILVATAGFLAAFKYDLDWVVRVVIVFTSGLLSWYVFSALVSPAVAAVLGGAVAVALWVYPEWYVVNTAGVLMGAGAAGLFGITFGILPALILLVVLAVYDAISVYKTKHMLDLADGVMDLRIPAILIIPLTLSYSLLDDDFGGSAASAGEETTDTTAENGTEDTGNTESDGDTVEPATDTDADGDAETTADGDAETTTDSDTAPAEAEEKERDGSRDVFFIGLGDAVIPGVLIASAAFFSPAPQYAVPLIELNLPALLALVGTIGGLLVLMSMVMKGKPHAGLPLLNGGAIGGYLVGSILAGVSLVETVGVAGLL